jgi:AbrB family looped-hinge helix DNA binding protein
MSRKVVQSRKSTTKQQRSLRELWTVVTRKGQVTVPAPIRREIGLKEGDKVAFVLEKGELRLLAGVSVVQRTAGSLKGRGPALTAEELREAAEQAIADESVERSGR